MPRTKITLPDSDRYAIFHSLDLVNKDDFIMVEVENHRGPPKYDLPLGTISQIVRYKVPSHHINADDDWTVVKAHQYLFPDGTIHGGPDPLYICLDDIVIGRSPRQS